MTKKPKIKFPSELRFDLVGKDWVVIATGRAKRPDEFAKTQKPREVAPIKGCPFEEPQKSGNPEPLLFFPERKDKKKDWWVQVVRNKFPAFSPVGLCGEVEEVARRSRRRRWSARMVASAMGGAGAETSRRWSQTIKVGRSLDWLRICAPRRLAQRSGSQ